MSVEIRSRIAGFRRCGVPHRAEWTRYEDDFFTEEQLDALSAEPMLQVKFLPKDAEPAEAAVPEEGDQVKVIGTPEPKPPGPHNPPRPKSKREVA